jgi:uncharacterized protein YcnI
MAFAGKRSRRVAARALAAALTVLAVPGEASGHVTIAPPYVEDGVPATIAFQTPNERAPHATTMLSVTTPPGIAVESATAPAGWKATVAGSTVTWTGGRLEGATVLDFPIRITPRVRAGNHAFAAKQTYDDGGVVRWNVDLSVLPATGAAAPKQHPWGAIVAGVAGLIVIALSVLGLRRLRRPPLQER